MIVSPLVREYLVLALEEETAVHAVVGFIIWAFRMLKKSRSLEMNTRGFALDSVCPQLSPLLLVNDR